MPEAVTETGATPARLAPFTVDDLAARTGLTVRTIRFYVSEGLVAPPVRRGRIAYYDDTHRMRLDLIRTLQDHGYTLAAIERVLARVPDDAGAAEYAVQAAVLAPWLSDEREVLDRAGLDRRAGRHVGDDELRHLRQLGVVERRPDGDFLVAPAMLGHAVELMRYAVPAVVLRESADIIETHAAAVAEGLTDLFVEQFWAPYQRGEIDHEHLVGMLARLRPLAVHGLVAAFGHAADRAARRGLEPGLPDDTATAPPPDGPAGVERAGRAS
ncbi:MerR family transcriptional regulator [Jatrophihabitans sp. YIM 134969]